MDKAIDILALEPYFGGSHKYFLEALAENSHHNWKLKTLPPYKWKWRMMHSAVTFADQLSSSTRNVPQVIFCTDMLNLAEFRGLAPVEFASIPAIVYFHENQLTYPTNYPKQRDRYFGWINITTALAADVVWFNSRYHMNAFLDAVTERIKKAPDFRPAYIADKIRNKAHIVPQIVRRFPERTEPRTPGPLRILWAARWEYDKNPDDFFEALRIVRGMGRKFRLSVIGGDAEKENSLFDSARIEFADSIEKWGYIQNDADYIDIMMNTDIAVSTAIHEFFGISIAESISAGAFPLVPDRLAYPEIIKGESAAAETEEFFYKESPQELALKIAELADRVEKYNSPWLKGENCVIRKIERFYKEKVVPEIDEYIIEFIKK